MAGHKRLIKKLKRWLEIAAFISLFADIAISAITVLSLKFGELYFIGILFAINYLLTVIVVVSLLLIFSIAILSHYRRITRAFRFFRFEDEAK